MKTEKQIRLEREIYISDLLKQLGIPASLIGYECIKYALILLADDNSYLRKITISLYPMVGRKLGLTAQSAERAIRHSIGKCFERGNTEKLTEIFQYSISASKGKATNSEFLATLLEYINLHFDSEE